MGRMVHGFIDLGNTRHPITVDEGSLPSAGSLSYLYLNTGPGLVTTFSLLCTEWATTEQLPYAKPLVMPAKGKAFRTGRPTK